MVLLDVLEQRFDIVEDADAPAPVVGGGLDQSGVLAAEVGPVLPESLLVVLQLGLVVALVVLELHVGAPGPAYAALLAWLLLLVEVEDVDELLELLLEVGKVVEKVWLLVQVHGAPVCSDFALHLPC